YRSPVTLVRKGCWTGPSSGEMQSNEEALPPDYSLVRGCSRDLCNTDLMTGNFSIPVYIRTCHRPSCTTMGTTSPWTAIDLQGSCCEGQFCNGDSVTQDFTTASATTPPRAPQVVTLLLAVLLLVWLSA
ncbi:ly6/PLAUR domain-containing protein 5, partial [Carlito syrichta]|uniref:Ly6/PLAUR domain-containing protein 5 n=1 Tax=Carlito syrichta TaxID=1868482 RepID=A0A3Q0EI17_CARSF